MTMSKGISTYLGVKVSKLKAMCGMSLDSTVREERAIEAVTPDPIPASKFVSVYKQRVKNKQLATEFKALIKNQEEHPSQAALKNVLLNNKQDVVPCDHSRVIVWEGHDVTGSDYYNASYIDGYSGPKEYIACQGPSSKSFAVFWHMIWQEGVTCVVMATGLFENAVQQCDKYWVDHSRTHAQYGQIHVWHEKSTYLAQLNIRSFRLQKEGSCDSRLLTHYEMVGLHEECPSSGLLLDVRRRVSALIGQNLGPVLVHCRCGGGRSAVYLAVDYCLHKLQAEDRVDVYSTVLHLRRFRKNMVKTVHQYQQIYDAVAMYLQCGLTVYPRHLLPDVYQIHYARRGGDHKSHRLEREFQSLQTVVPKLSIGDCASGHRVENRSKSRDVMMLPPERARPYLTTADCGDGGTDFINAVYVDGYHAENTFLVTQWPLKRTIGDLWRLFFDFKMTSLVVMHEVVRFSRTYPRFWPKEINQVVTYGPVSVRYISCVRRPDLVIRTFAIRKIMNNLVGCELRRDEIIVKMFQVAGSSSSSSSRASSLRRKSLQKQSQQTRQLKVDLRTDDLRRGSYDLDDLHLQPVDCRDDDRHRDRKKRSGVGLQSRSLLAVMEHVEDWQKRSGSRQSVCVLSKDGCSRAGLYCTVSNCCDQLKAEAEIDVFNAVRHVRHNRPHMVPTLEEYRYVYRFMTEFIQLCKTRPDIIITKPASGIFSLPELEKAAGTRAAIAASSLHGGVYIRNQPPAPGQSVAKHPRELGNSSIGDSESQNEEAKASSKSKTDNHVQNALNSSGSSQQGTSWNKCDSSRSPVDKDNSVVGTSRESKPPSREKNRTVTNSSGNSKELVVGRGSGVLSPPAILSKPFEIDSDWAARSHDGGENSGASDHSSLPSTQAASIGQLTPQQRHRLSPLTSTSPSTADESNTIAAQWSVVQSPEELRKLRTKAVSSSLLSSWKCAASSYPTLSPHDIPVNPCACGTNPNPPPSSPPPLPHPHPIDSSRLSPNHHHHASSQSPPPMQRVTQPHLQKCFLSPGTFYSQGSPHQQQQQQQQQLTKASLSSLCTNSSFHSCHSSVSEIFARSAANSPTPSSPIFLASTSDSNPRLLADDGDHNIGSNGGSGGVCSRSIVGSHRVDHRGCLSNGFCPVSTDTGRNNYNSNNRITASNNNNNNNNNNNTSTTKLCASVVSLSAVIPGVPQNLQVANQNSVASLGTPLSLSKWSSADSTLIHASYVSLEDSVEDSLDYDRCSTLEWLEQMEQNNNAHAHVIKGDPLQAERAARKEAGMGNSFFSKSKSRSRSKVMPWPSPLSFVKKIKDYRLNRKKT